LYRNLGETYYSWAMSKKSKKTSEKRNCMKLLRQAEEAYMEAIRLNPENPVAHYDLGLVYLELGERDRAFDEYRILKTLDSGEYAEKLFKEIYKEKDE